MQPGPLRAETRMGGLLTQKGAWWKENGQIPNTWVANKSGLKRPLKRSVCSFWKGLKNDSPGNNSAGFPLRGVGDGSTFLHIYMCVYAQIHTCMHACMLAYYTYIHTYLYIYVYSYMHIYAHEYVHIYMYVYTYLHLHICIYMQGWDPDFKEAGTIRILWTKTSTNKENWIPRFPLKGSFKGDIEIDRWLSGLVFRNLI